MRYTKQGKMSSKYQYPLNNWELNSLLKSIRSDNYYLFNTDIEERIGCQYGYITRFTKSFTKTISEPITNELIELFQNQKTYIKKRSSFKKRTPKPKIKTSENSISSKDLLKKLKS